MKSRAKMHHYISMRGSMAIVLFTILTWSYGQVPLGEGIVKIIFNDSTVLEFYNSPTDKVYVKRIEFFDDKTINSWNIKNIKSEGSWLKPELLWLDYSQFNFRCKSIKDGWLEVITNNDEGKSYWIKRNKTTQFFTWEMYFKEMFSVGRTKEYKQKIRSQPSEASVEMRYEGNDCFQVKSLQGDWIEIFTVDYCGPGENQNEKKSGWIRWRLGEELVIKYYTTS